MTRRLAVTAMVIAVASCWLGCEEVPDIRFVDDDASAVDAGGAEGGRSDGASEVDAAVACTSAKPAGGTCCGTVWCLEDCRPEKCDACARAGCDVGEVCCGKTGNVVCKKASSGCP